MKNKTLFEKEKEEEMIDMRYFYENPTWIKDDIPIDKYLKKIEYNFKKVKKP